MTGGITTVTRIESSSGVLELAGTRVLIVGLGSSGLAATRLAARLGARVTLNDQRDEGDAPDLASDLAGIDVRRVLGGHPLSLLDDCDLIVVSPGVPMAIPLLQTALAGDIPVWSEIELASRVCRGRVIAVTGSNGKSTVTTMIGSILSAAGIVGGVGGNLATPFSTMLQQDGPDVVHSLELSSFQLETTHTLEADVAVLTNFTPDHLDRYDDLAAYGAAKSRLFAMQSPEGVAVFNADDEEWPRFSPAVRGRMSSFSVADRDDADAIVLDRKLVLREDGGHVTICGIDELTVVGSHNVANALAAVIACHHVGVQPATIRAGLLAYRPLPHRLEPVRTMGGVDFYNDSKATNPDAAIRAIEAFPDRRIHWILGGKDKDGDWNPVVELLARRECRVLLIGDAAEMLAKRIGTAAPLIRCGSMDVAVRQAAALAAAGDVVLLAPGCASFDQFLNFEDRGEQYRMLVQALTSIGGQHA
ncbi:MAG: UDP-N-acetylmuramoyl-L-alanine--D-glutamate ligase [Acidobacteriota bacterium]|nr:UDP-N-acetylmuramoyl-L-alanine--D-glutamate ligase [Acidobacteriota bacterium]MDH3784308.1 UDP-N-acetylmuramoyl-L-alanine--D-glutamate ligase [Acidobacteriota bacterium]